MLTIENIVPGSWVYVGTDGSDEVRELHNAVVEDNTLELDVPEGVPVIINTRSYAGGSYGGGVGGLVFNDPVDTVTMPEGGGVPVPRGDGWAPPEHEDEDPEWNGEDTDTFQVNRDGSVDTIHHLDTMVEGPDGRLRSTRTLQVPTGKRNILI